MTVDPLEGVSSGKGKCTRQQLVEGDAQRVEIAPRVDGAIHPPSLLGGHIRKRAGNNFRWYGRLAFVRELGRNPESGKPYVSNIVDEHVGRFYVLMYKAVAMDLV